MLRLVIVYGLTVMIGITAALGLALLVGIWFPQAKVLTFLMLSVYWLYLGWRHASLADKRHQQDASPD